MDDRHGPGGSGSGPAVALHDVGFGYVTARGVTQALTGVSLEVPRGSTVAFVGPSGCGKSTLLKLIAGLLTATAGSIVVDGQPVGGPLKNVGMAFQNPVLLPWRSVLDNVLLPLEILRENGDPRASEARQWRDRAVALLATVGLDEPFAALDAFTREEMWELYQRLRAQREFTGVLVTHDLREAVFLADTIYVLASDPGRIAHVHHVTLPRPRTLAQVYGVEGTELMRRMREQIRPDRETAA